MELGEKIKAARLEAGLSQRQLCGDTITRNMLSQIEHGAARPSMDTLKVLAQRLGRPLSWFLEEEAFTSPNQQAMTAARHAFETEDHAAVLRALEGFREPDPVFDAEASLLRFLSLLRMAEKALREGREPYARSLLERSAEETGPYITAELQDRRRILAAMAGMEGALPGCDELLLLQAGRALKSGRPERAIALLEACHGRGADWYLATGLAHMAAGNFAAAVTYLEGAETAYPKEAIPNLETAHRELGDFKKAYEYACKARAL